MILLERNDSKQSLMTLSHLSIVEGENKTFLSIVVNTKILFEYHLILKNILNLVNSCKLSFQK
jgi:hypothetical protein